MRAVQVDTKSADAAPAPDVVLPEHVFGGVDDCCPICLGELEQPVSTRCGHVFCLECIHSYIPNEDVAKPCPYCRVAVLRSSLVAIGVDDDDNDDDDDNNNAHPADADQLAKHVVSSKVEALLQLLSRVPAGERVVVFSQFRAIQRQLQRELSLAGICFAYISGSMSLKRRGAMLSKVCVCCGSEGSAVLYVRACGLVVRNGSGVPCYRVELARRRSRTNADGRQSRRPDGPTCESCDGGSGR